MREGWEIKKLIELGEIQTGTTPSTKKKEYYGDFIPFIKPPHFNADGTINYDNSGLSSIGLEKGRLIKENSILMVCIGATIGKTGLTSIPVSCNQQINSFTPNANLEPKFFYYLLSSSVFFKKVIHLSSQATLPMINKSKWQSIEVSFPKSLQEQKQIVALLDKAFTAIDQAKTNIEKNIENAKELFQSKLNDIFSQKGDGWEEDKLKNITTKIGSGATPRGGQAAYKESGISLIRSMNVHDGGFTPKKLAFIDDEQAAKLNNVIIEENDVLLNITGASVARCCLALKEFIPARVNQHVSIIRPIKDKIDSNYLHFLLTSKKNKDLLLGIGEQGSTRQAITKVQIENFVVSYPKSIEEQKSLIAEVTTIKTKNKKIIKIYKQKLKNLEDLKKSILQKAFAGELTKQLIMNN